MRLEEEFRSNLNFCAQGSGIGSYYSHFNLDAGVEYRITGLVLVGLRSPGTVLLRKVFFCCNAFADATAIRKSSRRRSSFYADSCAQCDVRGFEPCLAGYASDCFPFASAGPV
jgi:hypothetical protein